MPDDEMPAEPQPPTPMVAPLAESEDLDDLIDPETGEIR